MEGKMEHSLMEDKRLDLDAPLLSVRRHTTAASISNLAVSPSPAGPIIAPRSVERTPPLRSALPFYKSELKSGPVRNPGVVPFVWEHKPGQPKCEAISRLRPPPAPSLPPGRILNDRGPERFSGESSISVADLATKVCEKKSGENPTTTAALMVTVEDDDNFSDAVETLSRAESFFMNCSVSGLSGIQDAVEPTDCFSADSQVRDFMMGRFLPAAQAMASGLPQYSSRKPPKVAERAANGQQRLRRVPLPYQQTPKFVAPPYPRDPRNEICSADDESYESDYDRNFSSNACGLLPRLCLLNPMPGREVGDRRHRPPLTSWNISKIRSNKTPLVEAENELFEAVCKKKVGWRIHNQGESGSKSTSDSILDGSSSFHQSGGSGETLFETPKKDSKNGRIDEFEFVENDRERHSGMSSSHESQQGSDARNSEGEKGLHFISKPFPVISLSNSSSTDDKIIGNEITRSTNVDSELRVEDERFEENLAFKKFENADSNNGSLLFAGNNQSKNNSELLESLLPPPLPNAPSESWLLRTLPSISSKIQSGQAFIGIQVTPWKQAFHSFSMEPKLGSDSKPSKLQNLQSSSAAAAKITTVKPSIEQLCELSSTQPKVKVNFKSSNTQHDQMLDVKPFKPKPRQILFADVLTTPLSPRSEA